MRGDLVVSENNCTNLWCDYLHTQFDLAHLLSELGFEIVQAVVVYIIWKKYIKPRWFAKAHQQFDETHGLTHKEDTHGGAPDLPGVDGGSDVRAAYPDQPPLTVGASTETAWRQADG
jgi:hypothetical protein